MTIRYAPVSAGRRFAVHGIVRREILIIVLPRIARPIFFVIRITTLKKIMTFAPSWFLSGAPDWMKRESGENPEQYSLL